MTLSNNAPIILPSSPQNIHDAAYMLHQGEIVAFPTETVYGLGGVARDATAIAKIYHMKGRPSNNPLIVHVTGREMAQRYGIFTPIALQLAEHFFPAPLTLIVPVRAGSVATSVLAGGNSIALRCPAHPIARALIEAVGEGIAAPSANLSGHISPTHATHVASEFVGHSLRILEGDACAIGLESTVVDCRTAQWRIVRHGAITATQLMECVGQELQAQPAIIREAGVHLSPGQLASHYAPHCAMRLNATHIEEGEVLLAFGEDIPFTSELCTINLSARGDITEAAHHFYAYLRQLETFVITHPTAYRIAVSPLPEQGIGIALNDRLRRAACGK